MRITGYVRTCFLPIAFLALGFMMFVSGCLPDKTQQNAAKWRLTLDKEDKRPYGTYIAYQSLKYYFPDAAIAPLSRGFRYNDMDSRMVYNSYGRTLLVVEGLDFYVSDEEWKELKDFVRRGNELLIFCSVLDSKIEQDLYCYKQGQESEDASYYPFTPAHSNKHILSVYSEPGKQFGYEGHSLGGFFSFPHDSSDTETIITSASIFPPYPDTFGLANNEPDFVRYKFGEGHLTLHGAPLALSNYFLLQDGNQDYLTALWQTLPSDINRVYWNDYFKRNTEPAGLNVLMRYPATKWAVIIGILTMLLYILFEGKRKQRVIPVMEPLKNDSVSFVETVGRLYFNKGNHTNLAEKIVQQFLEWVRTHYFLNTNLINESFTHALVLKSGKPEATVRGLMDMISEIRAGKTKVDDAYLYQLYNTIQQFYKSQ